MRRCRRNLTCLLTRNFKMTGSARRNGYGNQQVIGLRRQEPEQLLLLLLVFVRLAYNHPQLGPTGRGGDAMQPLGGKSDR